MALLARTLGLSAIALGIAACSGDDDRVDANGEYDANSGINVSRFIGITKNSPDEFAVKTTKPLELPKNLQPFGYRPHR